MPVLIRNSKRRAFTLVEVLVVCGIIGVLVAMLFPALARVRAQSVQLQCAANLRSWGQAFHIYADENRGFFPHSQDESANPYPGAWTYNAAFPQNECCYIDLLPPLMNRPSWSSFPDYQKPTADVWQCPLAQVLPDDSYDYSASQHGYHSYAMNQYLDTGPLPWYPPFFTVTRCRHPSATLLMFETTLNPAQASNQNPISIDCYTGCYADSNPRDLGDRHPHLRGKLGGNLLMIDGHVEWTDSLWDSTLPVPYRPPVTTPLWWPWTEY